MNLIAAVGRTLVYCVTVGVAEPVDTQSENIAMDCSSIGINTAGHDHTLSMNESGVWGSDCFTKSSLVLQALENLSNDSHEVLRPFYEDPLAIIKLLELALNYDLLKSKQQVHLFNAFFEAPHSYQKVAHKISTHKYPMSLLSKKNHSHMEIDLIGSDPGQLLSWTLAWLYWSMTLHRITSSYSNESWTKGIEIVFPFLNLGKDGNRKVFKWQAAHPIIGGYPTDIIRICSNMERVKKLINDLVGSASGKNSIWEYSTNTFNESTIIYSQWVTYFLISAWYEAACWEGHGQEVLPAFIRCFNIPSEQFHDMRKKNYTVLIWNKERVDRHSVYSHEYWIKTLSGDCEVRNHNYLLPPDAFAEMAMIRALHRERIKESYPNRHDDSSPKDLFPTTTDMVDATPPNSTARKRLTNALPRAEIGYLAIEQNLFRHK